MKNIFKIINSIGILLYVIEIIVFMNKSINNIKLWLKNNNYEIIKDITSLQDLNRDLSNIASALKNIRLDLIILIIMIISLIILIISRIGKSKSGLNIGILLSLIPLLFIVFFSKLLLINYNIFLYLIIELFIITGYFIPYNTAKN